MTDPQQQNQWLKLTDGQSVQLTILDNVPDVHVLHWVGGAAQPHEESNCPWCQEGVRASVRHTLPIASEVGAEIWEMADLTWKDLQAAFKAVGYSTGMQLQLSRRGTGRATRYTIVPLGHDPNAAQHAANQYKTKEPAPLGAGIGGQSAPAAVEYVDGIPIKRQAYPVPAPTAIDRARAQRAAQQAQADVAPGIAPAQVQQNTSDVPATRARIPTSTPTANPYDAAPAVPASPISGRTMDEEIAVCTANPQSAVAHIREMAATLEINTKDAINAFHASSPDTDRNAPATHILAGVTQMLENQIHNVRKTMATIQDDASNNALLDLIGPTEPLQATTNTNAQKTPNTKGDDIPF